MKHATHTLIVSVAATILGVPVLQGSTDARSAPEPVVSTVVAASEPDLDPPGIYGADRDVVAAFEAAIDRYNTSGLTLPPLRIYVHTTRDSCSGYVGVFNHYNDPYRIDMCAGTGYQIFILHELAHAWAYHTISDDTRQAFLNRTGLVWNHPDVKWPQRGTEVLAKTIAWGLRSEPLTVAEADDFADRLEQFQLLTGVASPRLPSTQTSYTRGV